MTTVNQTRELRVVEQPQPDAHWLLQSCEEPLDPDLEMIDAHHHFSEHWGGYMPQDLVGDGAGHNMVATVYVQCGWQCRSDGPDALKPVGETEAVVAATRKYNEGRTQTRVAAAIVGYADLRLGIEVDRVLEVELARFSGQRTLLRSVSLRATLKIVG